MSGAVSEFRPGCPPVSCTRENSAFANLTVTEIVASSVQLTSSGNPLPPPVVIGMGSRLPPAAVVAGSGDVEDGGFFDPAVNGIDFFESLEGMRVLVRNPIVVGPRNARGEIAVLADLGASAGLRAPRGGIVLREDDPNPERIILDNGIVATPAVDVGDLFAGDVTGVVDYGFGNFHVVATELPAVRSGGLSREGASAAGANELAIATFNLENLSPRDDPAKFAALAAEIVSNLRAPDLIGVQEVQDNNGRSRNSVVDATVTFGMLIEAIAAAGGPAYEFRDIPPLASQDGGEPGGNIRVGFLFRTDRGLRFIDRPGGDPTTAIGAAPGASGPQLSFSPGGSIRRIRLSIKAASRWRANSATTAIRCL